MSNDSFFFTPQATLGWEEISTNAGSRPNPVSHLVRIAAVQGRGVARFLRSGILSTSLNTKLVDVSGLFQKVLNQSI